MRSAIAKAILLTAAGAAGAGVTLWAQQTSQPVNPAAKPKAPSTSVQAAPATGKAAPPAAGKGDTSKTVGESSEKPSVTLSERARQIAEHTTWAYPMFKAGETQVKEITQIDHFPYLEQLYQPSFTIEERPEGQDRFGSPEEAMISRTSEMMHADYDAWLAAWDPASQKMTEKIEQQQKITPQNRLQMWKAAFTRSRFTLAHRIQTGQYVILTYQLTVDGRPAYPAEFPVIFHQLEGRWYATQDLSKDPLPSASPWLSGQNKVEVEVRPLQLEKTSADAQAQPAAAQQAKGVSR